jgi:L-malate glycosyltransferase
MKVIHIDTGMEWRGGQSQVLMLASGLRYHGCNTIIIAKPGSILMERAGLQGVLSEALPLRFEADLSSARQLSKLARSDSDTILHAHTAHALGLALLAKGLSSSLPIVFTRRVTFPIKKNFVNRWKLKQADRIVAVSQAVADQLSDAGIAAKTIRVIHSGVDLDQFAYHGPHLDHPKSIAIAGAVEKEKGLAQAMELIELSGNLPVMFHFVGTGSGMASLRKFADSRNNILIHGFVENIATILKSMFALISFSPSEGFPNTVLQAMASGLPVLARENSGVREMIPEESFGSLFHSPADALATFKTMLNDTDKSIQTGKKASDWVRSQFSKQEMVRKNYELYKEILT